MTGAYSTSIAIACPVCSSARTPGCRATARTDRRPGGRGSGASPRRSTGSGAGSRPPAAPPAGRRPGRRRWGRRPARRLDDGRPPVPELVELHALDLGGVVHADVLRAERRAVRASSRSTRDTKSIGWPGLAERALELVQVDPDPGELPVEEPPRARSARRSSPARRSRYRPPPRARTR